MIKIENVEIFGFEAAIRGMRNPMNSWIKSDSYWTFIENTETKQAAKHEFFIGKEDLKLMKNLSNAGDDHGKFLRFINVTLDITAPLYWWKEFDTYKVGTVANSCSTMHKIHEKEFQLDDFSHEHLNGDGALWPLAMVADVLNQCRELYLEKKEKFWWWQIIQLLPSSYNQRRTVQLNYQVLKNIFQTRKNHKLDEWVDFCNWIKTLPYYELITGEERNRCICCGEVIPDGVAVCPLCEIAPEIGKLVEENGGYCPCECIKDEDSICPCKEYRENGICYCGRYKNWKYGD